MSLSPDPIVAPWADRVNEELIAKKRWDCGELATIENGSEK
jgi:hypothetical protein